MAKRSRSVTAAARLRVVSVADRDEELRGEHAARDRVDVEGADVVRHVPHRDDRGHGDGERRPALPEAERGPDEHREDEVRDRGRAPRGEFRQRHDPQQQRADLEPTRARPALRQRRVPRQRERHDEQRTGGIAEPPGPPDRRQPVEADHAPGEERRRADRRADGRTGCDRDRHHADPPNAGERRPVPDEAPEQERRDHDLQHVAAGLSERRAERERPSSRWRAGRRSGRPARRRCRPGRGRRCRRQPAARRSPRPDPRTRAGTRSWRLRSRGPRGPPRQPRTEQGCAQGARPRAGPPIRR